MNVAIGEICQALRKYNILWRPPLWRYRYFWRSYQATFCQGWSHVSSLCSFELIIKGVWWTPFWRLLKHTQLEHDFWRFPIIHFWSKTPCDFIHSIEIHTKTTKWELGLQTWICIAAAKQVSIFRWFYRYIWKTLISQFNCWRHP